MYQGQRIDGSVELRTRCLAVYVTALYVFSVWDQIRLKFNLYFHPNGIDKIKYQ